MADVPLLHETLQGKAYESGNKDNAYRPPTAAEKLTEGAIGTGYQGCKQIMVDARRCDNLLVTALYHVERQMVVVRRQTTRTKLGLEIKLDGIAFD